MNYPERQPIQPCQWRRLQRVRAAGKTNAELRPRRHLSLIFLGTVLCLFAGTVTDALKLTEVSIPKYADLRESVQLSCKFDITRGKLYSVKWYKDDFEFYRYMPDSPNRIQTFPVTGVQLNVSRCNRTTITLQNLSFNSSGNYKCEVSKDGPNFETVVRNGNMTIIVYPDGDPVVTGIAERYSFGDFITGNCTSYRSNPVANLSWYINNQLADSWLLERYPILNVTENRQLPLYSRSLGLRFRMERSHFSGDGRLQLKCTARIGDLKARQSSLIVYPNSPITNGGIQAQNRVNRSSSVGGSNLLKLLATVQLVLLSRYV